MKTNHNVTGTGDAMLLELVANVTTQIIIGRATTVVSTTVGLNYSKTKCVFPTSGTFIATMSEFVTKMGLLAFVINNPIEFLVTTASLLILLAPTTTLPRSIPQQDPPVHLPPWFPPSHHQSIQAFFQQQDRV
jgi:hypothetical protein